jgi:catechol 2,3-dioxygenase-like lactoylglutathione lyase family enzyme
MDAMPSLPTGNPAQFYQGAPLLLVPDVMGTADFYREVLGFRSDAEGNSPEYSVVWRDNASVHLARGEKAPAGVRIFFWVKDVDALYEELGKRGIAIEIPIETRPYRIRDFAIRDPNGVLLVFGQDWD